MIAALSMCTSFVSWSDFIENTNAESVSYDYSDDKLVSVIVSVKGDTVLDNDDYDDMKEYLQSDEAAKASQKAVSVQQRVQNYIKRYYPELKTEYSYTVLLNGFSCEIPESLIDVVKEYPLVKNVSINNEYLIPDMAEASVSLAIKRS